MLPNLFKRFTPKPAGIDPCQKIEKSDASTIGLSATPDSENETKETDAPTIGLLRTPELESVIAECKSRVARIAKQCRARNSRFRDVEFDLENDRGRCLHSLVFTEAYSPADIQRVTELFETPKFFIGGPYSDEMMQGKCGDCWFIAALAATSTVEGLVEQYCVARDEQVGVYGFLFWRDVRWVSVIVDDSLFVSGPKYEELSDDEKALFRNDKERYTASARTGSQALYFAKSGQTEEIWVPLVEKAYAKLHGDYGSLFSGYTSEAFEDLTGGVLSFVKCKEILDKDRFWKEELLRANRDRLFSFSFSRIASPKTGDFNASVSGLRGGHSYPVLRALECKGKRFLVLRNPSGRVSWTGPWSDGSKNWTPEWMDTLAMLGHLFGDTGKFIMEYTDALSFFSLIDRTIMFDSEWTMKYEVLRMASSPFSGTSGGYGAICFTLSLSKTASAIIVLSELDERYFQGVRAPPQWYFNFTLYRRGEKEVVDESAHAVWTSRSTSLEFEELEEGEYIVHCSLEKSPFVGDLQTPASWNEAKRARTSSQRMISESVAANIHMDVREADLPIPLHILAGQDLVELARKASDLKADRKTCGSATLCSRTDFDPASTIADTATSDADEDEFFTPAGSPTTDPSPLPAASELELQRTPTPPPTPIKKPPPYLLGQRVHTGEKTSAPIHVLPPLPPLPPPSPPPRPNPPSEDGRRSPTPPPTPIPESGPPFLGLKVYTHKDVSVAIHGQLRDETWPSFEGLTVADWNSLAL